MAYLHGHPDNVADAFAILPDLLAEARLRAARRLAEGARGPVDLDWARPRFVTGVHVHPEGGGWRCDLTLDAGPDAPGCIGAPDLLPDRAAAEAYAVRLLSDLVLAESATARMPRAAWPVPVYRATFLYDRAAVALTPAAFAALRLSGADALPTAFVRSRLDAARERLFGGRPATDNAVAALGADDQAAFVDLCCLAVLKGLDGWPEPAPAARGASAAAVEAVARALALPFGPTISAS